jgi:GTP-binding protein HflX
VDITHPNYEEHIEVVNEILTDLSIENIERLLVFNKVDLLKNNGLLNQIRSKYPNAQFVSGKRHIGMNNFKKRLLEYIESQYETDQLKLSYASGPAEHLFHSLAKILDKQFDEQYLYLTVKYPVENKSKIFALAEKYK